MRNNPNLRPSKLRKKRRKLFILKSVLVFLLIIAFIFLLSWLSKMPSIQIGAIEVSGNVMLSKSDIVNLIKTENSRNIYGLFSKNSIFLYPKKEIERKIINDFKKVQSLKINSSGLKTLVVNITERKPDFMWCDGYAEAEIKNHKLENNCYFMDKEGAVFSEAPSFSGNMTDYMKYYGLIKDKYPIGKIYMDKSKFTEIIKFIDSLKNLGMMPTEFQAEDSGDYNIYLENGLKKIIFDESQPFEKTLENIRSISGEIDLKKDSSLRNSAKYNVVDLRFGNKVFLRSEE